MNIVEELRKVTRDQFIQAFEKIDSEGIPSALESRYYDLIFNSKKYPPKLVISYAIEIATGESVKTSTFQFGKANALWPVLINHGFDLIDKEDFVLKELLKQFVENSLLLGTAEGSFKTSSYATNYKDLETKVSFGQGSPTDFPWMAFLGYDQEVSKGIYPVILFSRKSSTQNFEICYGRSATEESKIDWDADFLAGLPNSTTWKYPDSVVQKTFTIASKADLDSQMDEILEQLSIVISHFHSQMNPENFKSVCSYFKESTVDSYLSILGFILYKIEAELDSQKIVFSCKNGGLNFIIGQRYAFNLSKTKNGQEEFGFITNIKLIGDSAEYKGSGNAAYFSNTTDPGFINKHIKAFRDACTYEFDRTNRSGYINSDDADFRAAAFENITPIEKDSSDHKEVESMQLNALNTIFYGPPGTGKTVFATKLMDDFEKSYKGTDGQAKISLNTKFVTFHQSYSYEDFIEGIKPVVTLNGNISYDVKPGTFKIFCDLARKDEKNKYLFVIDEINRGNISKIFGELITLIEESKRENKEFCVPVQLQYSKESFTVPSNVYLVGTMNTADRSIANIDLALRRRFVFVPLYPDSTEVKDVAGIQLNRIFQLLNKRIQVLAGDDHQIGHAFFMGLTQISEVKSVWFNKIIPLIQEYFYGDYERIKALIPSFVIEEKVSVKMDDDTERVLKRLKNIKDYKDNSSFIEDMNNI